MTKIFFVDDDLAFLEMLELIPLENAEIRCFASPIAAIAAFNLHKPDIIVSDIQMPGIHGIDFATIAQELMRPQHFLYISANSIEEVREKFGHVQEDRFYRKPLGEDFFNMIDCLALEASKLDRDVPPSEQSIMAKMSSLEKIFDAWKRIQDFEFKNLLERKFGPSYDDEYHEVIEALEADFHRVANILDVDDQTLMKLVVQFEERHPSCEKRIRDHIKEHFSSENIIPIHPLKFESKESHEPLKVIHEVGCQITIDGAVCLRVNGAFSKPLGNAYVRKGIAFKNSEFSDGLENLMSFLFIKDLYEYELQTPTRNLFHGKWRSNASHSSQLRECMVSFPLTRIGPVEVDFVKFEVDKSSQILTSTKEGDFNLHFNYLRNVKFPKFAISNRFEVSVREIDSFEYECHLGKKLLKVPLDIMVQDEKSRGFQMHDSAYYKSLLLMNFIWEVALGVTQWRWCQQEYKLEDFLGR